MGSSQFYKEIKLWNLERGVCIKTLCGHTASVDSLVVLPGGLLASGSHKTIKLWDLKRGECTKTLRGHGYFVYSLVVLPSGQLASGSADKTIMVWDVERGSCTKTLSGHTVFVRSLEVLPDGKLVSGSADHTIKLWDVKRGILQTLRGHGHSVNSLAVLPSGLLASGAFGEAIKLWEVGCRPVREVASPGIRVSTGLTPVASVSESGGAASSSAEAKPPSSLRYQSLWSRYRGLKASVTGGKEFPTGREVVASASGSGGAASASIEAKPKSLRLHRDLKAVSAAGKKFSVRREVAVSALGRETAPSSVELEHQSNPTRYRIIKAALASDGDNIDLLYEAGQLAYELAGTAKYPQQQLQLAKESQRYLIRAMRLDSLREDVAALLAEVSERLDLGRGLLAKTDAEAESVYTRDSLTGSLITPEEKGVRRMVDKRLQRRLPATLEEDPAKVIVQQLSRRIVAEVYRRDYFAVMNSTLQSVFAAARIIETGEVRVSGPNYETAARILGHFVSFIPGVAAVAEGAGRALDATAHARKRNGYKRILQMIPDRVDVDGRLSALSRLFTVAAEKQLSHTDPALQKSAIGKKFFTLRAKLQVEIIDNGYKALAKEHAMSLIAKVMDGKVNSAMFLSTAVVAQIIVGAGATALLDEVSALTGHPRDVLTPTLLSLYPVGVPVPAKPVAAASAAPAVFFSEATSDSGAATASSFRAEKGERCVLQ